LSYTEGMGGLARALRIAGAKNGLVTLTPVDDLQTRDFMLAFYTNWLKQPAGDAAVALRQTKQEYAQHAQPKLRDPHVWSSYVLIGG
jgi:CHAT domain-containing protein